MKQKIKLVILTLLVYGIPILLWSVVPFSKNIWGSYSSSFIFNYLFYGKIAYSAIGIIFDLLIVYCAYLLFRKDSPIEQERVYLISSGLKKIFSWVFLKKMKEPLIISREEKTSVLFYLVKLFFTPVMISFTIGNISSLIHLLPALMPSLKTGFGLSALTINALYIPFLFYLMLAIDTSIFSFGYLFESPKLKNVVKSVEPTVLGWIVAIMWYPPINDLTGKILGWYTSDFSDFGSIKINLIVGLASILLFIIYVWASIALGFKASNLTNRGIVAKGPYRYVRHPAYASKNLSWWIMAIPFIKINGFVAIFSMVVVSFFYFLRALTEERHLMQDPDYVEYTKKVKYMFIPGVF